MPVLNQYQLKLENGGLGKDAFDQFIKGIPKPQRCVVALPLFSPKWRQLDDQELTLIIKKLCFEHFMSNGFDLAEALEALTLIQATSLDERLSRLSLQYLSIRRLLDLVSPPRCTKHALVQVASMVTLVMSQQKTLESWRAWFLKPECKSFLEQLSRQVFSLLPSDPSLYGQKSHISHDEVMYMMGTIYAMCSMMTHAAFAQLCETLRPDFHEDKLIVLLSYILDNVKTGKVDIAVLVQAFGGAGGILAMWNEQRTHQEFFHTRMQENGFHKKLMHTLLYDLDKKNPHYINCAMVCYLSIIQALETRQAAYDIIQMPGALELICRAMQNPQVQHQASFYEATSAVFRFVVAVQSGQMPIVWQSPSFIQLFFKNLDDDALMRAQCFNMVCILDRTFNASHVAPAPVLLTRAKDIMKLLMYIVTQLTTASQKNPLYKREYAVGLGRAIRCLSVASVASLQNDVRSTYFPLVVEAIKKEKLLDHAVRILQETVGASNWLNAALTAFSQLIQIVKSKPRVGDDLRPYLLNLDKRICGMSDLSSVKQHVQKLENTYDTFLVKMAAEGCLKTIEEFEADEIYEDKDGLFMFVMPPMFDINHPWIPLLHRWDKVCSHCNKKGDDFKFCGHCKSVRYCSKECQLEHWKTQHKHQCKKLQQERETAMKQAAEYAQQQRQQAGDE